MNAFNKETATRVNIVKFHCISQIQKKKKKKNKQNRIVFVLNNLLNESLENVSNICKNRFELWLKIVTQYSGVLKYNFFIILDFML